MIGDIINFMNWYYNNFIIIEAIKVNKKVFIYSVDLIDTGGFWHGVFL